MPDYDADPQRNAAAAVIAAYGHWKSGQIDAAAELCREILTDVPDHFGAHHVLGLVADAKGQDQLAVSHLESAAAAFDAPAFVHEDLAKVYRRQRRLRQAAAAARRAVAADVDRVQAWNLLAVTLMEAGELVESRQCFERVVEKEPRSIEAHNNLGIALQELGDIDGACAHYRSAIELDDTNAAAHGNLAAALGMFGRFDEALAHAKRAIDLSPDLLGPHLSVAFIESGRGRHAAALHSLERAFAMAPNVAAISLARAEALRRVERAEEALDACLHALTLSPEDGEVHNTLGLVYQALGRDEEALAAFDRAALLLTPPGIALTNKAALLMQLGRRSEALTVLDDVLGKQPDLAAAWYTRAEAKTFTADDSDIAAMDRLLSSDALRLRGSSPESYVDGIWMRFALGKACLDCGANERGFAHLAEGNRLKRAVVSYDAAATERWMSEIAEAFPLHLFDRLTGIGDASELPVFVLGMPRSGTTLVEQILASHPDIYGAGELPLMEKLTQRGEGTADRRFPPSIALLRPEQLAEMGRSYVTQIKRLAPAAARIVDKRTSNFLYAGLIRLMLPQARIIHTRRDPVDTCFSCYSKLFSTGQEFSYDLTELGGYYRSYRGLMAHWRAVLPPDRFLEIDYESVVSDLETNARRMIDFCGLPWDSACLRFHETIRPIRTASMNQVRRPVSSASVGRWKAFQTQLKPLLDALGGER